MSALVNKLHLAFEWRFINLEVTIMKTEKPKQ